MFTYSESIRESKGSVESRSDGF